MLTYFSSFSCTSQFVAAQLSCSTQRQHFLPSSSFLRPTFPLKSIFPLTNSFSWSCDKSLRVLSEIFPPPWKGRKAAGGVGRSPLLEGWIFCGERWGRKKVSKTSFLRYWGATRLVSLPSHNCFTFSFVSYFCCNLLREEGIGSLMRERLSDSDSLPLL